MPISKIILIIIIILLIAVVVLAVIYSLKKEKSKETGELPVAEEKTLPEEVYGFSGTITEIRENGFLMEALVFFTDGTSKKESRKVLINEDTKITKLEFPQISPEARTKPIEPKEVEISLSDLKIGDKVDATSKENIQGKDEFTVESINVIE